MDNLVACYSGSEYAERPLRFTWEDQCLEIEQVDAQWRVPGEKCFRVKTKDGRRFMLKYSEELDEWQVDLL